MDLRGTWRAAACDEQRRRTFHEHDHDDSEWLPLAVPGHWAEAPELASEESVLYRHRFTGPDPTTPTTEPEVATGPATPATANPAATHTTNPDADASAEPQRWWLRFEGLAQQGDVWLDGVYLGHTDGYFVPHEMEITDQLSARHDHVLAVEATCRRLGDPNNRATLTGALQDPELVGLDAPIMGGLWRPVLIRSSGRIAIRYARAVCADVRLASGRPANSARVRPRARLVLRAVLDVPDATSVQMRTQIAGTEHIHVHSAAAGENRVKWTVDVDDPKLWWPHALGSQALQDLTMEAVTDAGIQDRRRFRIGLREVSMRHFVLRVNGERIHLKGANLLPVRTLPGTASPAEAAADIGAARSAGLDLVRPVAHIARPELYQAADELGMLIWQDLPIRGLMSRSVSREARRQAREAVDLLGHHPSLVVWCAHDEPFARPKRPTPLPPVVGWRQNPSWNRDVLDRRLCRVLTRCDETRPVVPHTAVSPRLSDSDGTTSNVWLGWHGGRPADLGKALARVPRMGRFVSAFGTPVAADAAEVVKTTVETLRRLKYNPNGGFLFSALADVGVSRDAGDTGTGGSGVSAGPGISTYATSGFGALDGRRRPKPAWDALVDACRPTIVICDPLPSVVRSGGQLNLAVHVVNDRHESIDGMTVRAQVLNKNGLIAQHHWTGMVGADECTLVGRIKAAVPPRQPNHASRRTANQEEESDLLTVELKLRIGGVLVAQNRSQAPIR